MSGIVREAAQAREAANLRLPVPFFDLLMVLLVTCLVFVAPLPDGQKPDHQKLEAMDVAIAHGKTASDPDSLLPAIPHRNGAGWDFEVDGRVIAPAELGRRAAAEGRKVVLVLPPATALQDFVNMQSAVAALNVPFALAIKSKEEP